MGDDAQAVEEDLDVFDEVDEKAETETDEGDADKTTEEPKTVEDTEAELDTEMGEKEEEPPASEDTEDKPDAPKTVPISVMTAQRRENQRLKAELEQIKNAPDPYADPEGFTKHITESQSETRRQERIEDTREIALDAYPDFEEKEALFVDLFSSVDESTGERVITNQALFNEMRGARNPAKFAYEQGTKQALFLERSDPDYEKKVEQRLLAKLKKGGVDFDFDSMPDLTNVAATSKNTDFSETETEDPGRLDMFDEDD